MNDLDKAQMMAPEGEFLAYINPKEAGILKALGGSGKLTSMGIPSFTEDEEDQEAMNSPDYSSQDNEEQESIDRGDPTANMSTNARDLQGYGPGTNINDLYGGGGGGGGGNNFIQTVGDLYNRFSPVTNIGRGIGNLFDMFAELRGFNPDGSPRTQRDFEDARTARQNQNRISNIMGREAPFTRTTLNNLEGLYGEGNVPSNINESLIGTTNAMRTMNDPIFGPVTQGTIYDAEEPDLGILSQAPDYNFRDAMREINLDRGFTGRQNRGELIAEQLSFPYDTFNTGDPYKDNLYDQDGNYKPSLVAEQLSFPYDFMNTGDPYKDNLYDRDGNYKPSLSTALGVRPANNLFADVSPADLMLNNMRGSKQYSLDDFKGFSENQTLTEQELDGIRNRTITSPTGRFKV